ncbi:MAG: hypothetical protein Ct9H300mP13_0350 [Gammaproteobacteria bacterium]|nr:MAG: hypothetical protein Ct9H300mP13_0350 [Gammaproteobacteria bacterium]
MHAVKNNADWNLVFPAAPAELEDLQFIVWRAWPDHTGYIVNAEGKVACRIYKTIPAKKLWDLIMSSTYDYAEPGFVLMIASTR